jgi:hypothetical protein
LIVLAIKATEGASGKENGSSAFYPRQGRFLSEMGEGLGYLGRDSLIAESFFPFQAICPAGTGAELAGNQMAPSLFKLRG